VTEREQFLNTTSEQKFEAVAKGF